MRYMSSTLPLTLSLLVMALVFGGCAAVDLSGGSGERAERETKSAARDAARCARKAGVRSLSSELKPRSLAKEASRTLRDGAGTVSELLGSSPERGAESLVRQRLADAERGDRLSRPARRRIERCIRATR